MADFSDTDGIALPSIKVSIQAISWRWQAVANIKRDPTGAINKYVAVTGDNTDRALMEEMRVVLPCAAVRPMPHVDPTGRSCRPVT